MRATAASLAALLLLLTLVAPGHARGGAGLPNKPAGHAPPKGYMNKKRVMPSGKGIPSQSGNDWLLGTSKLHQASWKGDLDLLEAEIAAGADVNNLEEHGRTALHFAAYTGKLTDPEGNQVKTTALVKALIDAGADVNVADKGGSTALHEATPNGNTEIAKLLIAAGANVAAENKHKETPHDIARHRKHPELVTLLKAEL